MLILRHAQSTWNAERRFQGQSDPPLSELGREQAADTARRLAPRLDGTPVLLVASDLKRAASTAEAIAGSLGVDLEIDPALREVAGGAWQGLMRPAIEAGWPADYRRWLAGEDIPWGGEERHSAAGTRVAKALRHWAQEAVDRDKALVAVGHGGSLRAAMADLLGWSDAYRCLAPLGNVSAVELTNPGEDGRVRLVRWNASVSG
jgi:glucosyl-3-phosphoglycerate phosphatase